jgi:predicted small lipoprotein YifL
MLRNLLSFSLVLLILALAACGAPPPLPQNDSTPTAAETPETASSEQPMPKATFSPELQAIADQASTILSEALDVSPEDVTILEVQRVEWSDASLGCPEPGMMYAQVITPGYLVTAEVDGEEQMVHMNEKGDGVVCPPERAKPPISAE